MERQEDRHFLNLCHWRNIGFYNHANDNDDDNVNNHHQEALCQLISETVGRCGEIWERCHSEEEVGFRINSTRTLLVTFLYSFIQQLK